MFWFGTEERVCSMWSASSRAGVMMMYFVMICSRGLGVCDTCVRKDINEIEVFLLARVPGILFGVLAGIPGKAGAEGGVVLQSKHLSRQRKLVIVVVVLNDGLTVIEGMDRSATGYDGNAKRHELENLCTKSFVSEGGHGSFGLDGEISSRHDAGYLATGQEFMEEDAFLHPELIGQADERGFGGAFSIDVKVSVGNAVGNTRKGANCNIYALMPVEGAGIGEEEPARGCDAGRTALAGKNAQVRTVANDAAFTGVGGPCREAVAPEMVGDDDMCGKACRTSFDEGENTEEGGIVGNFELAGVELREEVMDIEEDGDALQFCCDGGEDQEVRHVVNVHKITGADALPAIEEESGAQEKAQNSGDVG